MLRNIQNAKVLFCSGMLQPRGVKDAKKPDTVVNPVVDSPIAVNPTVKSEPTKPIKIEMPSYSEITKKRSFAENITDWLWGEGVHDKRDKQGEQDKQGKQNKQDQQNKQDEDKNVKEDL